MSLYGTVSFWYVHVMTLEIFRNVKLCFSKMIRSSFLWIFYSILIIKCVFCLKWNHTNFSWHKHFIVNQWPDFHIIVTNSWFVIVITSSSVSKFSKLLVFMYPNDDGFNNMQRWLHLPLSTLQTRCFQCWTNIVIVRGLDVRWRYWNLVVSDVMMWFVFA